MHNKIISGISVELNKDAANELRQTMTDEAGEGRRRQEETRGGKRRLEQAAPVASKKQQQRQELREGDGATCCYCD